MIVLLKCGDEEDMRYDVFEDDREGNSVYESIINGMKNLTEDPVEFVNDCSEEELPGKDVVGYTTDNGHHYLLRFSLSPEDPRTHLLRNDSAFLQVSLAENETELNAFNDKEALFIHTQKLVEEAEKEGYEADIIRQYDDDVWIAFRYFHVFAAVAHKADFKEDIWA